VYGTLNLHKGADVIIPTPLTIKALIDSSLLALSAST
jgi:hypothetical protein